MPTGHDILLDPETGDLLLETTRDTLGLIPDGIVFGDATAQHQAIVLQTGKGSFKDFPTLGVGIIDMVNDDDPTGWRREIALQLDAVGMKVKTVSIDTATQKLTIDAGYSSK
jgi:hypothetical protein